VDSGDVVVQEIVALLQGEVNADAADHFAIIVATLQGAEFGREAGAAPERAGRILFFNRSGPPPLLDHAQVLSRLKSMHRKLLSMEGFWSVVLRAKALAVSPGSAPMVRYIVSRLR
jgi:hypothetical protein